MSVRAQAAPAFGNPAHWAAGLPERGRAARYGPERISAADPEAFHLRFLAQCAVQDAQMTTVGGVVHLVDVVHGSAASLAPRDDGGWEVREAGPVRLWERVEEVVAAFDSAGRPGPEQFRLRVCGGERRLVHPRMCGLELPGL